MPAQFTMPPDTRAVGTGNPPADVNAHTDALNAMGTTYNVLNAAYAGGADPTNVADSTAAFQAAITAATAVNGEVVIPPGAYSLLGTVNFTGPVKVRGLGSALSFLSGSVPAVTLNGPTGASNMFAFPFQGSLWGGLEMSGIGIRYTGTGNVFHQCNITESAFRDMAIVLTGSGSCAYFLSGANSFLNIWHERVNITTTNSVRTVPMISISSSASGAISNNTFIKCKFTNAGFDATQPMVLISCTASGAGYHYADNFIECWFEFPYGGCYQSLSGQDIKVDGCMVWDIFTGSGQATTVAAGSNGGTITGIAAWANPSAGVLAVASTTGFPTTGTLNVATSGTPAVITYTGVTPTTFTGCVYVSGTGTVATGGAVSFAVATAKSLYYFGAAGGNSGSQGVLVSACGRNRNMGPNGGSTCWDVECESTTSQVQVQGYTVKPDSVSTLTNAFFNFHGCNDVLLLNNQSPQGSGVNGNSTTVITSPSPTQLAISQGVVTPLPAHWVPTDSGYLAWNFDPGADLSSGNLLSADSVGASGTVHLIRVNVRSILSVTNVLLALTALGTTLTSGQNFAGLYNSAGTLIGTSADQTANWQTGGTTGIKTIALTGGPFTVQTGFVWVAILSNWSGTAPTFGRAQNNNAAIGNAGTAVSAARWAASASTGTTALPTPITPASNTATQISWWAALS